MNEKIKIGVVYGGNSGEHDISLQTAFAVLSAMDFSKYEIHPFFITQQGEWNQGQVLKKPPLSIEELSINHPFKDFLMFTNELHVMFPLLHGPYGEDGTVQGLFEMFKVPYVGAGVLASAVGMDKVFMKGAFAQANLPQCKYTHFTAYEWKLDKAKHIARISKELGYPCFVKPANLGSSVGITKVKNEEDIETAIELALTYDRKVIIEENVSAREIEISVLGNDVAMASVPGEIVSQKHDFYNYTAKYLDNSSQMVIPAVMPSEVQEKLKKIALQAFKAIDGSGLSRVDMFLTDDQEIFINEINTMPGFTPFSMYPKLWEESGISYADLIDRLIQLGIERCKEKSDLKIER